MKRLFAVIISIMLLFGIAYAEDYSNMTDEELYLIQDSVRNELLKRKLASEGNILLLDADGISVYLTGEYDYDYSGKLNLNAIVVNDTDREFAVYTELSVNGWDVYSNSASLEANPHKKNKAHLTISIKDAEISTYEEVQEIEFRISYWFKDDNMNHKKIEPFTLQFPLK